MWLIKFDFLPKILSHSLHLCLRIRRCTALRWAFSDACFVKDFPQISQKISRMVLCIGSCRFRSLFDLNDILQCLHEYFRSEICVSLWDFKLDEVAKNAEQISHWNRLWFDLSVLCVLRWCNKSFVDVINSRVQICKETKENEKKANQ